jgi:hypothetical protein
VLLITSELLHIVHDGLLRDPERCIFLRRLDQQRELDVTAPVRLTAIHRRELCAQNSVKCQHLLRERLVTGENQPGGARTSVAEIQKIEQRGDVRLERAFSPERFGEIEDELGLLLRQLVYQRLHRVVHGQSPCHVPVGGERGVELIEQRIYGRIECILAVEDGNLHESLADSVPSMALVCR